jgi:hypothetical protein
MPAELAAPGERRSRSTFHAAMPITDHAFVVRRLADQAHGLLAARVSLPRSDLTADQSSPAIRIDGG